MVVNNPNNWHWVDKNCIDWTRKYFNDKAVNLSGSEGDKNVFVKSVSSVEGDVEVCQRKGKVISLFDLKLVFEIKGHAVSQSKNEGEFTGSITVPELAYDSTKDDLQFDISIYNEDSDSEKMRPIIKKELLPKLRDVLISFGRDLITTHASDIQLSSDKVNSTYTKASQEGTDNNAPVVKKSPSLAPVSQKSTAPPAAAAKPESSSSVPKYNTSTLHLEPTFNTTAEQLYITLLDKERIAAWSRSNPSMEGFPPKEGSEFSLFGGSINGKFLKLVQNQHIVQLWRLEDWKTGHYAKLDMQLIQGTGETKMVVKWTGIPVGEEDRVRGNFEDYYIRSIKITFGFGAVL